MSRTRRDRRPNRPQVSTRDGSTRPGDKADAHDFATEVRRRDRRAREDEAAKIAKGQSDPDDVPTTPRPKRLWQFWRKW